MQKFYSEPDDYLKEIWKKFLFLDPSLHFLRRKTTRTAVQNRDRSFPLNAFRFALFPDKSDNDVSMLFLQAANRGIQAIDALCNLYLDQQERAVFRIEPVQSHGLFELIEYAFKEREQSFTGRKNPDPQRTLNAYSAVRAIELGYRVGMIDSCPYVISSVRSFDEVKERIAALLEFQNRQTTEASRLQHQWNTRAGVTIFSYDEEAFHARLKYLRQDDPSKQNYSSILMKMFLALEYPEDITDYVGSEFIVEDDKARDLLVAYFRKETRPMGMFERFKDATKKPLGRSSSHQYGIKKFVLRIPVKNKEKYERIPVEFQVLTQQDHQARQTTEADHHEYKRRQFLRLFPALFPRQIYAHLIKLYS